MADFKSLLPGNATPAERSLEQASSGQLLAVPVITREAKDPQACEAALLPWLAWEYAVDTWNTDWTDAEKRSAIVRAPYINRHRGTKGALMRALVDSPFTPTLVEWFETTPRGEPYTFVINAVQQDKSASAEDMQDLINAVLRAKNLRSWFSVSLRGQASGSAYLAGFIVASETVSYLEPFHLGDP